MLSQALQRNAKHEARLSNISICGCGKSVRKRSAILRFAQNDICEMVCKPVATQCARDLKRMANVVCKILVTEAPLEEPPKNHKSDAGATVEFWGVVRKLEAGREIEGIEYEAHREMAAHQLQRIAEQACEKFGLKQVIVHHRIGFIAVGEPSLFLRVASPHRGDGFRASEWIVDELKNSVPIWKRPRFKDESLPRGSQSETATV
jgi:molybdopterin synthase catalytic subunit